MARSQRRSAEDPVGSARARAEAPDHVGTAPPVPGSGDYSRVSPAGLQRLQRLAGNQAVMASKKVQRHTISGAPPAPAPLSEEELQEAPVQGSHVVQGLWGRQGPQVQRLVKGGSIGRVRLAATDLVADGSATLAATVSSGRKVAWSIKGPSGTTIDPATGTVKAGVDTGGHHFFRVTVVASDPAAPARQSSAHFTLWSADAWQAKSDVKALLASPTLAKKGYKASFNGVYDAFYTPARKLLEIRVPIQFAFPDDPVTAKMSTKRKQQVRDRLAGFRHMFISNTQRQWGGRFTFAMAREPRQIWGALSPVRVKVKVFEPATKSDAYFTVHYKSKTTGRAGVTFPDVELFKGDLTPDRGVFRTETRDGERQMLAKIAKPVNVDATGRLDPASQAVVDFLGDYVRRLRQPPVRIALEGHDVKESVGRRRARIVQQALRDAGVVSPHAVTAAGLATKADTQVHMTPRVSSGFVNVQDVSAHEFGHMIGLPDEYPEDARKIGDKLRTYDRLKAAFGADYADQVGKVTPSTASIMHGGNQVRVQHYIHFWDTLILVSNLHAAAPVKKFGDPDWKING